MHNILFICENCIIYYQYEYISTRRFVFMQLHNNNNLCKEIKFIVECI